MPKEQREKSFMKIGNNVFRKHQVDASGELVTLRNSLKRLQQQKTQMNANMDRQIAEVMADIEELEGLQ